MNPYKILGIKPDASPELIRMRHKQLAKRFHPDRNANPDAIAKFKEIQAAFDILNDPIRRKHFDDTGATDRVTLDERRGRVLGLVVSVLYDLVVEMVRQGHDPLRHNLIKLLNDQFNRCHCDNPPFFLWDTNQQKL